MFYKILNFSEYDENVLRSGVCENRLRYAASFSNGGLDGIAAEYLLNSILEENRKILRLPNDFELPAIIQHGKKNKPEFDYKNDAKLPFFSMSHSEKWAAAVLNDKPIGIDIEKVVPGRYKIAERFLNSTEVEWINEGDKDIRFYKMWCVKESFLKASGKAGIISMKDCHIRFENDEKKANIIQKVDDNQYEAKILESPEGFVLAICYEKD